MQQTFFILAPWLLITVLATADGSGRIKRYVGQFGDMIRFATNREALLYNAYGNHCGFEGHADIPVVDEVDQCCFDHDRCYERLRSNECSSHWLGPSWVIYDWNWNETTHQLTCNDDNPNSCDRATCECDRQAAQCMSQNEWIEENKRYSGYDKFASLRFKAFQLFGTWIP